MIKLIGGCVIISTIFIAIDTLITFKNDERPFWVMLKEKYIVAAKICGAFLLFYVFAKMYDGMVSGCNKGLKDAITG